jgi:hypothetical protein
MSRIFIVGAPRSGTTLLQTLMAAQPDFISGPETNFFVHLTPCLMIERNLPPVGRRPVPASLTVDEAGRLWVRLAEGLPGLQRSDPGLSALAVAGMIPVKSLADYFFARLGGDSGLTFIEKTPAHGYFVHEILAVYPDAVLIHIVRDPRDVVASINQMLVGMGKKPRSAYERAVVWASSVRAARRSDLLTLRYEDLARNPEATLARVFAAIGRPFDPARVPLAHESARSMVRAGETWKSNNFLAVTSQRIGAYRTELGDAEIAVVERVCRQGMSAYGYPREDRALDLRVLLGQGLAFQAGRASRLARKLQAPVAAWVSAHRGQQGE